MSLSFSVKWVLTNTVLSRNLYIIGRMIWVWVKNEYKVRNCILKKIKSSGLLAEGSTWTIKEIKRSFELGPNSLIKCVHVDLWGWRRRQRWQMIFVFYKERKVSSAVENMFGFIIGENTNNLKYIWCQKHTVSYSTVPSLC